MWHPFKLKFSAAKKISVRFYCRDISQPFMFGQNRFQVLDLFRFFNFLLFFHLSLLSNRQIGFGKQHKRIISTKVKIVKKFRSASGIPYLGGAAIAKPWKRGTWKGEIVEGGQKGDKRHFRNRLFRPKWERNRRGDNTSP